MENNSLFDKIIAILNQSGGSLRILDISKALQIKSDSPEYETLVETLNILAQNGIVEKNTRRRYRLLSATHDTYLTGILRFNNKSGIVSTDNSNFQRITISAKFLNTALDGDEVKIKILESKKTKSGKTKIQGEIVEIITRNTSEITGTIDFDGANYFLIPDNDALKIDFLIPKNQLAGARDGDKVKAMFVAWNNANVSPTAKVIETLNKSNDPTTIYEQIIEEYKLPKNFPDVVLNEVNNIKPPNNRPIKERLDFRKDEVITIDPVTAKDFDDAVSLKVLDNGNYELGVHIADVSHYVQENSAIDKEAQNRGNSVYLVDRVIPMLPEKLSNIICSLNEDVVRYTFSVVMELNENYDVVNYTIAPSMIKSVKRFNYDEVQNIIDLGEGEHSSLILALHTLTQKIRNKRTENGSINYDTKEIKYILDEHGYPTDVEIHTTTHATALIEECMLLANKTVAIHLKKISKDYGFLKPLPFIYRIHDKPKSEAIADAFDFIKSLGYKVNEVKDNEKHTLPNIINNILAQCRYKPESAIINQVLIRSMPRAVYSAINIGHFGLGFSDYTHFTSPIRRYADLLVHRLLKEYAVKPENKAILKNTIALERTAQHISDTERIATEAERASNKLAGIIFAESMLGHDIGGTITGVTNYGLYILMDDIYCEGLLHIRSLQDDHYIFNEKKLILTGKKTKNIYSLGMRINVRIVKINIAKRQIDLDLAENFIPM